MSTSKQDNDILTKIGVENEVQLLMAYAKAWSNLDITYLKDILSDDFEYTSQWVFETMRGKDKYIDYLKGKFETIKKNHSSIRVQIGYYEYCYLVENKPCLILEQNGQKVSIIIEVNNRKIIQANMIGIPDPNIAIIVNDNA